MALPSLQTNSRLKWSGRICALLIAVLLAGCQDADIKVYSVPKEDPWKLPAGWQEQKAGGMRSARFSAPSTTGPEIDVSVIPIRDFGGSQTDVLNIWRQQMKLEPVQSDAEAAALAEKVSLGPVDGQLYDLTSPDQMLNGTTKARSLIAVGRVDGTTWFFKMTGDQTGVEAQKPSFVAFLKSANFNHIPVPSANMPGASERGDTPRGEDSSRRSAERAPLPEWQVPAGWSQQPPSAMLNAKFVIGADGARADVNVSVLTGDGGGARVNINRWRGQVGLPPWDEPTLDKNISTFDTATSGAKAMLVDFKGTDAKSGQPARLIGVIVPLESCTWFYKLMGDEQVAEREKEALIKMVSAAKHPNG
jgi:hypothetical protein